VADAAARKMRRRARGLSLRARLG